MSKYETMLKKKEQEGDGRIWSKYGLSEKEWSALTMEQRELHYARQGVCDHAYEYPGIETDPGVFYKGVDWSLREQYSHDPYFRAAHMFPCRLKTDPKCNCQMCMQKIGIAREGRFKTA